MKFHIFIFLAIIVFAANLTGVSAQADSAVGQITSSAQESFAGGISGDGRLVVFESNGNVATENPRNADGNREIFLFDYAQRRIFQITDTKSLLTDTTKAVTTDNTKVVIVNVRPVISRDGRWIAFGSNANSLATPAANLTPGNFDANTLTASDKNALTLDGNTELWLYQIPAVAAANLSSGSEIAFTDLNAGTFTRVTNTAASRVPTAGSTTIGPAIADDNREASLNENADYVAFVSNRDLVPGGNASADNNNNDEIFAYVRASNTFAQVTRTGRGTIAAPIYNQNPTISNTGSNLRVAFLSNAENPVAGMTGGSNADGNVEIYYTDLNAAGMPIATAPNATVIGKQVTTTTRTNIGDIVNVLDYGRRMSRDGRFIAFDSYADLANENGGTNQASFALYLYDTTSGTVRRVGPRSDADTGATGGDVSHFPGFTDYNSSGAPQTLVFESRLNIKTDGTIPTTATDGLNSDVARPVQIYSIPLASIISAMPAFTRLTTFPAPNSLLGLTQPLPSDSQNRMTFSLAFTEIGTGNLDLQTEAFYFLLPVATTQSAATFNLATGASRLAVSATPTPTPTTTPTPTPTPTPSVTPTPQTPASVLGVSPGLLTYINFGSGTTPAVTAQTAVGSLQRSFTLPIELSGVTVTVNGAAAGIKSVSQNEILFVVPPGLPSVVAGTAYPLVINNNGTVFRSTITIVPARPDIFSSTVGPGGRARVFNATNRVLTTEPFTATTIKVKGGRRGATVLRVFLTGITDVPTANITIRVGTTDISGTSITAPVLREPGIYSIDFTLPPTLNGAGDVPIIVTVNAGSVSFQSRLEDTAPRLRIL